MPVLPPPAAEFVAWDSFARLFIVILAIIMANAVPMALGAAFAIGGAYRAPLATASTPAPTTGRRSSASASLPLLDTVSHVHSGLWRTPAGRRPARPRGLIGLERSEQEAHSPPLFGRSRVLPFRGQPNRQEVWRGAEGPGRRLYRAHRPCQHRAAQPIPTRLPSRLSCLGVGAPQRARGLHEQVIAANA